MNYFAAIKKLYPGIEFSLQDDGQGVYIKEWHSDLPKPILKDLELEAIHQGDLHRCLNKRKKEYLRIEDQLDIIYHEGLEVWKSHIQKVKEDNPKP